MTQEQIERIILVEVLDFKKPERAGEYCQGLARNAARKILELQCAIGVCVHTSRERQMSSRSNYGALDNYGPEDNGPGTAFITHNVDDTITIKVRSPGDRVFSEIEMPLDAWIRLRSVGGPVGPSPAVDK